MFNAVRGTCTFAEFLPRDRQPLAIAQPEQNTRSFSHKALFVCLTLLFMLPSGSTQAGCSSSVCATGLMEIGSAAFAVSDKGTVVVGSAEVPFPSGSAQHAFLWENGVMVDLGTLGGTGPQGASYALDVSGNGKIVVGAATIATGETHAFRWTKSTGMVDIGTLAGFGATAWAVNSNGSVIVGQSDTLSHATHAFRWTSLGGMSDLGTLGGDSAVAYDVNDKGDVVVGISSTGSSGSHAFRWTSAGMTDLGSFGGDSQANAVNGSGSTVVGWSDDSHSVKRAFVWTVGTGMLNLGVLPGGDVSIANGVSEDSSVIVGWSNSAGTSARAVRWAGAQGTQDLNLCCHGLAWI
jgi:probable HAF family extracellular repeat protein